MTKEVLIDYTNWRGERSIRCIHPRAIVFGDSTWHPEQQWLLEAVDIEKGELRTFAMANIHSWQSLQQNLLKLLTECERVLVGYSVTGYGPEQPGDRVNLLGDLRKMMRTLAPS